MTIRIEHRQSSLKRRIRQFYRLLNQRELEHCHEMIDPRVRRMPSSVTLFQYESALQEFLEHFGSVKVLAIRIELHLNEPSKLYEGRDFALGTTTWMDAAGERRIFSERWVCENRVWYTRATGFITPQTV